MIVLAALQSTLLAMANLTQLSHSLSWGLRHKALELGWTMTRDGYVPVDEILAHSKFHGRYNVDDIRQVVAQCTKQRYKLAELPYSEVYQSQPSGMDSAAENDRVLCIRANQGHSIALVDPELLLDRLTPQEIMALPMMVHGTNLEAWSSIQTQGLKRMTRNHIHFAKGLPNESGVISGMRRTCQVYIYVDTKRCATDGIAVYQSDNGVLLTAGVNDEGTLPVDYFLRVTDASGSELSWDNNPNRS
jgi:2'-phosphotransferase